MNYELAKQLKDAGFPQDRKDLTRVYCWITTNGLVDIEKGGYYIPTLEELIEACGYGFRSLSNHSNGKWIVKTGARATGKKSKLINGRTPKEAVAKLWLELNKK